MKEKDSQFRRKGFSLIELMVVIGILAILIAALLPFMGGSRDSAMNVQCQNNMRNIAQAVLSWAQARSDNLGHFPAAGFYKSVDVGVRGGRGKIYYYPHSSWISNHGDVNTLNRTTESKALGSVAHFTEADNEERRFAITNGAIWHAVGESYEVYRCPIHAREFEKKYKHQPGWSYVMNQEFGFNRGGSGVLSFFGASLGNDILVSTAESGLRGKGKQTSRNPDKVLLFAEVQGVDVDDNNISLRAVSGSGNATDAVLEYAQEEMGFNHKIGKHKYGGNVAFADGHVENFQVPVSGRKDLTRWLCQGCNVRFDSKNQTYILNEDR